MLVVSACVKPLQSSSGRLGIARGTSRAMPKIQILPPTPVDRMARFEKDPGTGGNLINGASTDQQGTVPQIFATKTAKMAQICVYGEFSSDHLVPR